MIHPCMLEDRSLSYITVLLGQEAIPPGIPFPGGPVYQLLAPLEYLVIFGGGAYDMEMHLHSLRELVDRIDIFGLRVI